MLAGVVGEFRGEVIEEQANGAAAAESVPSVPPHPSLPLKGGGGFLGHLALGTLVTERVEEPKPTAGYQRVLQRAAIHAQSSGCEEVTGATVLFAMFPQRESHAVCFLRKHGTSRFGGGTARRHG